MLIVLALVLVANASFAQSPVSFDKTFGPSTIGPGSVATLEFTITNGSSGVVRNLAFSDTLPAAVTIASPARAVSTCNGSLEAPSGGDTITFTGGSVGANLSCSLSVNVVSATAGTHTNVSAPLTSDLGSHGTATADLVVATDRPGFLKSFAPSSVLFGARSTMTLTIDNSANGTDATNMSFTDDLPAGMDIADPPNVVNTCGGAITAPAGGGSVSLSGFFPNAATVAAGASCTIAVDVVGNSVGALDNVTGELNSTAPNVFTTRSSGKAGAVLTVTNDRILLDKTFVDDPAPPGGNVVMRLELRNLDRSATATDISFTDDLGGALAGLSAVDTPVADPCGAGSSLSGTGVLSFSGGSLAPAGICTFDVTLQVPAAASSGIYFSETSEVSADLGGRAIITAAASDLLVVSPVPRVTAEFIDDPVGGGGSVTLEYSLTNTSPTADAVELGFSNVLDAIFGGASSLPANGFCGASSVLNFTPTTAFAPATISVSGASLAAGQSCTFSVVLEVSAGASAGFYTNTTSAVSGIVGGEKVMGDPATSVLEVTGGPRLSKEFIDDPVAPGAPVTLEFSLSHDEFAVADAQGIAFTDDLDAALGGLVAVGTPQADVCGAGSQISGAGVLSMTGGTLAPGETCTFSVTLEVPASAAPGTYTNTTSNVVSTVSGETAIGNPAQADLRIAGLTLDKTFVDDPALPGGTVSLRFTIENINPVEDATGILFFDDLDDVVPGLSATGLPAADVCGAGSSLSGSAFLSLQNGNLAAGTSCTFDVLLQVPSSTPDGEYSNVTTGFSGEFGGVRVFFDNAADNLLVQSNLLALTKTFIDDPVSPGDTVTLRFEVTNLAALETVTGIGFTDDLEAALSGLESISGVQADICGAGSEISGTSLLTFSGGTLAGAASCSFEVTLQVPSTTPLGGDGFNTTSPVTGEIAGIPVDGPPASDVLEIDSILFTKAFGGPAQVGSTVPLTFTIQNLDATEGVAGLKFVDDLSSMLPGTVAVGLPVGDVCGSGSLLESGAMGSSLSLGGGSLLPGGSCSFTVTVQVPGSASPGSYLNVTSDLTSNGLVLAAPAVDTLVIEGVADTDGDGVLDALDVCPDTVIPEGVPTVRLGINRFALVDGDGVFDTATRGRGGIVSAYSRAPRTDLSFTIEDTAGCSCEQIIEAQDLGNGHVKFGCSIGAMREWVELVNP